MGRAQAVPPLQRPGPRVCVRLNMRVDEKLAAAEKRVHTSARAAAYPHLVPKSAPDEVCRIRLPTSEFTSVLKADPG